MNIHTIILDEVDSTNTYLRTTTDVADADVVAVRAAHQSAGRGMGGNKWESEAGRNLLFSLLVRPKGVTAARQFVLSMAGALALKDALDNVVGEVKLKWPNDVYWRDRKLSGTLIETSVSGRFVTDCIIGSGINVNQRVFRSNAPNPVSLAQITGRDMDIDRLFDNILNAFCRRYAMVLGGEYDRVQADYSAALYRRTGVHAYRDAEGRFDAELVGVGIDGRLTLRDTDGRRRNYAFKEVEYII